MSQKNYVGLNSLSTFLDKLKTTFALLGHKHTVADITDYSVDTELSPTSTKPVQNKVINAELDAIAEAMQVFELALDDKAAAVHNHNDVYYTKSETDTKLTQKSQVQIITWGADD